ncbi:MAG TPA: radical SAM protein [Thermoplasmatales archaeon]|nr:radical SAM protein [Thermoplasmatales archaeon]
MITLFDGFVDEPACLGVPPYISPYIRYIAGAIRDAGEEYEYITVEEWRKKRDFKGDILIIFAGAIVPGKYLRGMPISFKEFLEICKSFKGVKILAGPSARFGFGQGGGKGFVSGAKYVDFAIRGDDDAFIYDFLNGEIVNRRRKKIEWKRWSVLGAEVVEKHPDFPQPLICEIETYRGCVRWFNGGCSFCIEPLFGKPAMREERDIIREVKELVDKGVANFRIGCQSCFFSYKAVGIGKTENPKPNISAIKRLLEGIAKLNPSVLHIDNANPAVLANWEGHSLKICELIKKYCTPGNVAALGMESADESVIKKNNLNATPEQVMKAIEIINSIGEERGENGMPIFLPGLNFVYGLDGESKATYIKNFDFLNKIMKKGYLLRRINIRQVAAIRKKKIKINKNLFKTFKRKVNEEINKPMLQKIIPKKIIMKDIFLEINIGRKTFGRQVGSYPILVCLPYKTNINRFVDAKILDHSYRSVTGIEYPVNINRVSFNIIKSIPNIGEKRAAKVIRNRPYKSKEDFLKLFNDNIRNEISEWIEV